MKLLAVLIVATVFFSVAFIGFWLADANAKGGNPERREHICSWLETFAFGFGCTLFMYCLLIGKYWG